MEIGLVHKIDIDSEMQQAYLDYAMSVIVARALPDARDGLKPVHRRILYAMYDMGLRADSPYKKSARIVGEVLGKYHPHGDMAVYDAMARMAQDFSMRYQLVDGQGNFGSVDGDSPAAMRYTEARLAAPALNLLADIQKETVNFSPNFDGSLTEPDVLPAAIPNLLVNGATGIAVGMSTSIPPHNLGEVVDALKHMLENWNKLDDITVEDLMRFVQGPDFPTGGVIIQESGEEDLQSSYGSGRGRMIVQARSRLEEMERGRSRIIVTELPFMTNKAALIERIAELVREERLEGIADLRDESDRQGMRIVIELTKTADPESVLRDLYKHTPMQSTFSLILLALVDGEPRMLSLKQALRVYLDHRLEIVKRRSQYDLDRAKHRAHILEGLRIALKYLDEVIDLIRKAPDAETARERLIKRFKLTEIQAQAILDLQLRRLASLERKKIEQEYKDVQALIKDLEILLRSPVKMRALISDELQAVKDAYGDRRRTQIVRVKAGESRRTLLTSHDLAPDHPLWVTITPEGLISRTLEEKTPRLSGSGAPAWLLRANGRDVLYLVSERGEAAALPVHSLPEKADPAEGVPYWKASPLRESDALVALFALPPKTERSDGWYVLTATRSGMLKKSDLAELPGPSAGTFTLVRVNEGDRLGWLRLSHGQAEILLVTSGGMAIRFGEEEVRPMGLVAAGVLGIRLQAGDELAGLEVLPQPGEVFLLASDGSAKRVPVKEFPRQGRYGQGVGAWKLAGKARIMGLVVGKGTQKATVHLEKLAPKAIRLDDAPLGSRTTRGAILAEVKGDVVKRLTVPWLQPRPAAGGGLVGEDNSDGGGGSKGSQGGSGKDGKGRGGQKISPRGASDENGNAPAKRSARPGPKASTGTPEKGAASKPAPPAARTTTGKQLAKGAAKTGEKASSTVGRAANEGKSASGLKGQPVKRSAEPGRAAAEVEKSVKRAAKPASQQAKRGAKPASKAAVDAQSASREKPAKKASAASEILAPKTRARQGTKPAAVSARTGAGKTTAPVSTKAAAKPGAKPAAKSPAAVMPAGKVSASGPASTGRVQKPLTTASKSPKPKARLAASMAASVGGVQKPKPTASTKPAASAPKSKPSARPSPAGKTIAPKSTAGGKSKAPPSAVKPSAPQSGGTSKRPAKPAGQLTLPELDQGPGSAAPKKKTGTKPKGKT